MANYDAEIRVGTDLDNRTFKVEAKKVEKSLEGIEVKAEAAREKLEALEKAGVDKSAQKYKNAKKELERWSSELHRMADEREKILHRMERNWDASKGSVSDDKDYQAVLESWEKSVEKAGEFRSKIGKFFADDFADIKEKISAPKKEAEEFAEHLNLMRVDVEEYANTLKELEKQGQYFGDADYDKVYLAWKNAVDEVKKYQAELNKNTEKGKAEEAAKEAKLQAVKAEEQRLAEIKANATVSDQKIIDLLERRKQILAEIGELEKAGVSAGYQEYDARRSELKGINSQLADAGDFGGTIAQVGALAGKVSKEVDKLGTAVKKTTTNVHQILSGIVKKVASAFKLIAAQARKLFSKLTSGFRASKSSAGSFGDRLLGLAKSVFIFNVISRAFQGMVTGVQDSIRKFTLYSSSFNESVSALVNALSTLKNAIAGAFAPLISVAIPYLVQLVNYATMAVSAISRLVAALTGKSTWSRAVQQNLDYASSLDGITSSAKKAMGTLAKFDDLDVLQKQDDSGSGGSGGNGSGAGDLWEEVPVDDEFINLAEKIKDIFSKLFAPLKEAWEREGKFVMDSWKYALEEVWKLVQDIGRDFLEVWNQEATIQMFADILHIIGDIGLIIGNLARNFREAWNENETGLHILENIRDIIAVIIEHIRNAADATVQWADKLNFGPLLTAIESVTATLVPVVDAVSGILEDFYTDVLLPLGKWTIEKGLPDLLKVFQDFLEKVDWEKLRYSLKELWSHLEPFAETVGEGLILFIERVSELVANFINSESFTGFLDELAEWMDSVTPEDVADGLQDLAKAFLVLKGAMLLLQGVIAASNIVSFISKLESLTGKLKLIFAFFSSLNLGQLFSALSPGMIGELGIKIETLLEGTFLDPNTWTGLPGKVYSAIDTAITAVTDFIGKLIVGACDSLGTILVGTFNWDATFAVFESVGERFEKAFKGEEIGKNIILGICEGIIGALGFFIEPVGDLFTTLFDAICSVFGIHSPSTVFQEIGTNLIEGLLLGIQEMWLLIQEWFLLTFEELKLFFEEKWTAIKETTAIIWEEIRQFFSDTWTSIQETASAIWEAVRQFFSDTWTSIKETAVNIWNIVKQFFSDTWTSIQETAATIWNAIKLFFTTTWTNIQTTATRLWNAVKKFFADTWTAIKEKIQDIWNSIKEFFTDTWEKLKETAEEIWNSVKETFAEKMDSIMDKVKLAIDKFNELKANVSEVFENIKEKIAGTISEMIEKISEFIGKIREAVQAVKDFFSSSGSGSSGSGSGVSGASAYSVSAASELPHLASGAVIRGGNPFLAVLGDQRAGQTNIEAPLSTIRQALREELGQGGYGIGGGSARIIIQLNGQDVGEAIIDDLLSVMNRKGLDVEVLGVT